MNSRIYIIILLLSLCTVQAQNILQGPTIGAVTHQSAKIYLRAQSASDQLELELSPQADFASSHSIQASQFHPTDHSSILSIPNLQANTQYFYRVKVNGQIDTVDGHFLTAPEPNLSDTFVFVTGSCQETENMKVFDRITELQPRFFVHTGDYTYPDYQMRPDYCAFYELVAESYHRRYDEKRMKYMLRYVPIDYVYDDNDYVGGGGGRYNKNDFHEEREGPFKVDYSFVYDSFPPFWRRNAIRGYADFFPHYELPDTSEGIYHSFQYGNVEVFFLDRSSARDPGTGEVFTYDEKRERWYFNRENKHRMFGEKQMNWLKEGLKNSTADWKFIASGVPLNQNIRYIIEGGMSIQNMKAKGYSAFHMASGFGNYFAAYPSEQKELLDFIKANEIQDVIVLSGDTHHNVMDDGRNAGLPEMNASGLSVTGTELAFAVKWLGHVFNLYHLRRNIWNQGGNGIGNMNFNNAFGKIKVVGKAYVELAIVDEDGETISSFKVYHSSHKKHRKLW